MKKTVAVLFGGVSSEHEVSLVSATSVIRNMPTGQYDLVLLGITRDGRWLRFSGDVALLADGSWEQDASCVPAVITPDRSLHGVTLFTDPVQTVYLDAVFPVLHGKNGEDGTVQGLLQLAGIPFVGPDCISSGACMDKGITNALADMAGIDQAKWLSFTRAEYRAQPEVWLCRAEQELDYPVFVKPARAGSSVGISKARDRESLCRALEIAFAEDKKVVLEAFVDGFEVECAVLGNETLVAGEVGQPVPCNEFYDYEAKYQAESDLYIPAHISREKREEVAAAAQKVFRIMGCEGLSRVDFFVTKDDAGQVLFNEINTIPGFTPISMYPMLMEAAGVPYSQLLDRLVQLAIQRGENEVGR